MNSGFLELWNYGTLVFLYCCLDSLPNALLVELSHHESVKNGDRAMSGNTAAFAPLKGVLCSDFHPPECRQNEKAGRQRDASCW